MRVLRHIPSVLIVFSGCVTSNPDWDPPAGAAQAETGLESSDEAGSSSGDLPEDGDDANESESDGYGDGDGDGDTPDPTGDGDWGDEDNDDSDGELVCGEPAPSYGPCPASCDECHDGVCWRYCGDGSCQGDLMVCPVSWSCHVVCIGKDSCKDATLACTGWGSCELECKGDSACTNVDMICGGGPCQATCAAGFDRPCEHLDVHCGGDTTALHCEEPFEGAGPSLTQTPYDDCGCTSDCEAAD